MGVTKLDSIMERVSEDTLDECLHYLIDEKLTCPCCGGAGEHYTHPADRSMQDVDWVCAFCRGWGYLVMQRLPAQSSADLSE